MNMTDDIWKLNPYELPQGQKKKMIMQELVELTEHHKACCQPYANYLNAIGFSPETVESPEDIPFLPVRIFKEMDLLSIDRSQIFKTMTSSGTTGQAVSRIYVDRDTAMSQQKAMIKILSDFFGKQRLPMLIIDSSSVLKDRKQFTARGAAVMGLQFMTRENTYALKEDMSLDYDVLDAFLEKHGGRPFLVFGFTFMLWRHFYQALINYGKKYDLSNAWMMSGGGWKKLISEAITQESFQQKMTQLTGITRFLDHYNMVEQTGCLYAECEFHHLHASIYSDVFVRHPENMRVCDIGEKGVLQLLSILPHSYPGHSLLTEDEGIVLGEDDCPCGRKGKYIKVIGRLKAAELRGCSDTYAAKF